jgi:oligo-1,6-glucosidase
VRWDDTENAGFTTGKPWFYVNQNYKQINVASQEAAPNSLLNFYRKAIALRKKLSCVRWGDYKEYRPLSGKHYLYSLEDEKQKILVVCSFAKKDTAFHAPRGFDLSKAELALCSINELTTGTLTPYEARVYVWNK